MKKYIIIFCFYNALFAAPISRNSSRPVAERPALHEGHQLYSSVIRQIKDNHNTNKPKKVVDFNDGIQTKINKIRNKAELVGRLEKPKKYIAEIKTIKNSLPDSVDISKRQRINYLLKKAERAAAPSLARRTHRFIQKKLGIRKKQEKVDDSFIEKQGKKVEPNKKSDVEDLRNLLSDGVALKPSAVKQAVKRKNQTEKEDFEKINDKLKNSFEELRKNELPKPPITLRSNVQRPVPAPKPEWLKKQSELASKPVPAPR